MSSYEQYLKKLDSTVQSFEIEWQDKLESMRCFCEDEISKTNNQHAEEIALLKGKKEEEKITLQRNFEKAKENIQKKYEAENISLIDSYNINIQSIKKEKQSAINKLIISILVAFIFAILAFVNILELEKATNFYRNEIDRADELHSKEIASLQAKHDSEKSELKNHLESVIRYYNNKASENE